ncbi:MAG: TlpA disulfide reductase family protein [Vicinamibacterales bacterium]|mgnify:CR=1 FL=1|nr:alkyl hydroperoxide reductase [Acidobacteriota bacterium]MDP6372847.1 TlpA disulfide reductase family protein [Vicinamibacterales bacterium]MDP6609334.1 TlpA disulfide reductase family protein [Vicinamibacterales bacterium]|tara:strand:- start:193 stop:747 length:555 start_codon:yes stop_codon:yes gene_type:complete
MQWRWMTATVAASALAFLTFPAFPEFSSATPWSSAEATESAACDADARAANLDFTLKDMNGEDVALASLKGKVILLNFWATWCGPCKVEIPSFVELQDEYRDEGLAVLGLSVDDTVEKLKPFAEEYSVNYPLLVGLGRDDVQEAFGPVWGIPVTFYIDREGTLCKKHMGLATKEQVERDVRSML